MSVKDGVIYIHQMKPKNVPPKVSSKEHMIISGELNGPASFADKILDKYGFPRINRTGFYFIENAEQYYETCRTIDFYLELMKGHNFSEELAIIISSDNTRVFMLIKEELERRLEILKEFALDHEILVRNTLINQIDSKTLYNIVQYLKALGVVVTIKNIEIFYDNNKENIFEFNKVINSRKQNYLDTLISMGCTNKEANVILEFNPYVLKMEIRDLKKSTAILWQYDLDYQMLTRSEELKKISPNVLFALTEYLKSTNLEINEENILSLYNCHDKYNLSALVRRHTLTTGKMGVIYTEFNRR